MPVIKFTAKLLFILAFPVFLLTASIAGAINCPWLYQYGFQKYDISKTTGIEEAELEKATKGLIGYFNSGEEYISLKVIKDGKSIPLFNTREVEHLKDVKQLFWLDYRVMLGALLYLLAGTILYLRFRKSRQWAKAVFRGSVLTLVLTLLLGLGALFDFDQLFLEFHLLSFANDFWMLDPSRDYLIMLFPGGFWYDTTLFIVLATVVGALVLGAVSIFVSRNKTY